MIDNEIIEAYFKARGWDWKLYITCDSAYETSHKAQDEFLPQILTDFPAFKEHVLGPMQEEGFDFNINNEQAGWLWRGLIHDEPIKDNNILHAAVIAATRYWESKDGDA